MSKTQQKMITVLEGYVKKDKICKRDIPEVISAYQAALNTEEPPISMVVDLVTNMHFAIVRPFAEAVLLTLPEHQQTMVLDLFLHADRISANAAHYGIRRVVCLLRALLDNDASAVHVDKVLRRAVSLYSDKGSNEKTNEIFRECVRVVLDFDYGSWRDEEVTALCDWMQGMTLYIEDDNLVDRIKDFPRKWTKTYVKKEEHKPTGEVLQEGFLQQGERLFRELKTVFATLSKEYVGIKESEAKIRADFDNLKKRYAELQMSVEELQVKSSDLNDTVSDLNRSIKELEDENIDLNRRLEIAYSAEANQAKYELECFRNDLVKRLGTKYQDYLFMSSQVANPESYQLLLSVLEDVFDTLRRKGIECSA